MKDLLIYIAAGTAISPGDLPKGTTDAQVQAILTTVFGISGAIALLIIVVSGFRYILSAGEPEKAAKAKNGIIYALVGLVLVITAQAAVTLVAKGLK